jgi:hypothetical protein
MKDPAIFTLQIAVHSRNERPKEEEEIVAVYRFADEPTAAVSGQYSNGELWHNESDLPWHGVQLWTNAVDLAKVLLPAKELFAAKRDTGIHIENNTDDRTITIQGVDLPPNHQAIAEGNKITVLPRTET